MPNALLSVQDVTKYYAVKVLDGIRFELRPGEVHAMLGSNGAGKSTLCRIIAGLTRATSGEMFLNGQPYAPSGKQEAERRGVQIVQQELCLIPTLTIAENIHLTRMPHRMGIINRRRLEHDARVALDRVGMGNIDPNLLTGSLGVGHQQLIEIATALDRDCRVLILDEPTSSLSAGEAENLFRWIHRLRNQGIGIIYISHRLDEVARIADRITVLRDGKNVCTESTSDLSTDDMVARMTGEKATEHAVKPFCSYRTDTVALRAEHYCRGKAVRDVSFDVHRGERLGIAGLVGAGRTELLRLLFGADAAEFGTLVLQRDPAPRRFRQPYEAVAAGLALVTEDRKTDGLLLPLSIRDNTSIASLDLRFAHYGLIQQRRETDEVTAASRELEVRCHDVEQSVQTLSGGNQQKVAIAKWLVRHADVFFFDEPTRGIDVAARRRIYRLFESLASEGKAIVVVSSDLDELLETCDRIAVMSAGKLVATFQRPNWSADRIMQAAFSEHIGVPE